MNRQLVHPGAPQPDRFKTVPVSVVNVDAALLPGQTLLEAVTRLIRSLGAQGAAIRLEGGAFKPFSYVMPAAAKDDRHVAWFSDRFDVPGGVRFEEGCVTYGERDGQPWLHCHAIWTDPDGTRRCGHLLPDEVMISEPIRVIGSAMQDGVFDVVPDPESHFTLFEPRRCAQSKSSPQPSSPALAVRLRPNVDVCSTLERICAGAGMRRAQVHGGVGSVIGTVFSDGREVMPLATEMFIRKGHIAPDNEGNLRAVLDVALVDQTGALSEGRLMREDNPVLITFELLLIPA